MFKIGKRIFCFILIGFLTFSVTSFTYFRSVHAFEWVGGALAFEEALKWTLALLGITATAGMTDAYWENYGDDFVEYATENGATQQEVTEWQMKLCEGVLDKGSQVWDRFMEWASSLVNGSSSGGSSVSSLPLADAISMFNSYTGGNVSLSSNNQYYNLIVYAGYCDVSSSSYFTYTFFNGNGSYSLHQENGFVRILFNNSYPYSYINCPSSGSPFYQSSSYTSIQNSSNNSRYFWNIDTSGIEFGGSGSINYIGASSSDSNFEGAWSQDIENTGVISSVVPDEADDEVALPYPGVSDSDNTASKDAYDEIIDSINDGTITQEQGIERIQEILKVIVYDTVTDDVLPHKVDPESGENENKEDKIQENKDNMSFTLGGLENVFPFCIPWDIYAFLTILDAPAVAPSFEYPFYNVSTKDFDMYVVDLSVWEPVAVVCRYGCDLMFIIGLALATRRLIGAGGGD